MDKLITVFKDNIESFRICSDWCIYYTILCDDILLANLEFDSKNKKVYMIVTINSNLWGDIRFRSSLIPVDYIAVNKMLHTISMHNNNLNVINQYRKELIRLVKLISDF